MTDINQPILLINRICLNMIQTFGQIQQMSQNFIKEEEQARKDKQKRERKTIVHFQRDPPVPNQFNRFATHHNHAPFQPPKSIQQPQRVEEYARNVEGHDNKPSFLKKTEIKSGGVHQSKLEQVADKRDDHKKNAEKNVSKKDKETERKIGPKLTENSMSLQTDSARSQKPKQPISAYFFFVKDIAPQIKKDQPLLTQQKVVCVAGIMWKNLSEAEKQPYKEQERKERQKYEQNIEEFYKMYPEQRTKKAIEKERRKNK